MSLDQLPAEVIGGFLAFTLHELRHGIFRAVCRFTVHAVRGVRHSVARSSGRMVRRAPTRSQR